MNRAVFLDRDGVINQSLTRNGKPYAPLAMEDFHLLPGVELAATKLKEAGFKLIVVTNQPDLGRGVLAPEVLQQMHELLRDRLGIDDFHVCSHEDKHNCNCRKPKPGMLQAAAQSWNISLPDSYMVGDRWRDIDAGRNAGCKSIWVRSPYEEQRPESPNAIVESMLEAALWILSDVLPSKSR